MSSPRADPGVTFDRFEMSGFEVRGDTIAAADSYPSKGTGELDTFFYDSEGNLIGIAQRSARARRGVDDFAGAQRASPADEQEQPAGRLSESHPATTSTANPPWAAADVRFQLARDFRANARLATPARVPRCSSRGTSSR